MKSFILSSLWFIWYSSLKWLRYLPLSTTLTPKVGRSFATPAACPYYMGSLICQRRRVSQACQQQWRELTTVGSYSDFWMLTALFPWLYPKWSPCAQTTITSSIGRVLPCLPGKQSPTSSHCIYSLHALDTHIWTYLPFPLCYVTAHRVVDSQSPNGFRQPFCNHLVTQLQAAGRLSPSLVSYL